MRIHFWNLFLSLFFALLVIVGFAYLAGQNRIFYDISIRDLILMSLAIFRLVRLFSYDLITKFIRDWFVGAPKDSFRDTLGALVNCPWCTGLWFSFIVVFFYFATIYSWPIILVLSLAAVGSLFQVLSNWIGWSAEAKKLEVQGMRK
ncbi:MAG: DUF1360 domain-containing protein [Candidatus Paceibacterota bacterium]